MSFSSPWLLWALFAVLLPFLIHLINRWRHKSISWGAMDFLLKAAREARGRKKLLHYLILLVRVLAIACLVLAMARPILSQFIGLGGSGVDEIVLIFDRSPSMEAKDAQHQVLREKMIPMIQKTFKDLGVERLVLIDSATKKPIQIESIDALDVLSQVKPSDATANFPDLLNVAAEYLRESSGKAEVWVASDMQSSNWQPNSSRWEIVRAMLQSLARVPHIRVLALRDRPATNTSVRVVDTKVDNDAVVVSMEIVRTGFADNVQEQLSFNLSVGNASSQVTCYVGNGVNLVHRRVPLPEGSQSGFGYVSLPKDDIASDDQFFFTFSPRGVANVSVHAQDNDVARLLSHMAAPEGIQGRKSYIVSNFRNGKVQLKNCSLLVWQGDLPVGENATLLESFIADGGTVLFLPPLATKDTSAAFLGVAWGEQEKSALDKFFLINQWEHQWGPLRDATDEKAIPAAHLRSIVRNAIVGSEARSLAQWEDSSTAVAYRPLGRGQAIFLATLPYYTWSNLADGNFLLPLLQRLADDGSKRFLHAMCYDVGDPHIPALEGSLPIRRDDIARSRSGDEAVTAGVYQSGAEIYATSRALAEDDLEVLSDADLAAMFNGLSMSSLSAGEGSESLVVDAWRLFLGMALLCLLLEGILCLPPALKKVKIQGVNVEL